MKYIYKNREIPYLEDTSFVVEIQLPDMTTQKKVSFFLIIMFAMFLLVNVTFKYRITNTH